MNSIESVKLLAAGICAQCDFTTLHHNPSVKEMEAWIVAAMATNQLQLNGPLKTDSELPEPTNQFERAFCDCGTPTATCELCGREHYNATGEFMEDGELELMEKRHKEQPDKYVPNDGACSIGHINGQQVVAGCPCRRMRRFEDFVWNYRFQITRYITNRATIEANLAASDLKRLVPEPGDAGRLQ